MKFDVTRVIEELSSKRYPLFVSERHLQVAFILKAKELYPDYEYIPEYVYKEEKDHHIDLMVSNNNGDRIAFEFKYIVAGGKIKVPGDNEYELRNHSAVDIRRYQCVKDISRLEKYVESGTLKCKKGYFILITNMHLFWDGSKEDSVAADFDIKDNSTLNKGLHKPKESTSFSIQYKKFETNNDYKIKYKDYAKTDGKCGLFKYLCVEVKK
ncbi:MAG: hypothetical protein IJJ00_06290 [Erysipelotrichaceae bacterium]|nr:hypothetical protein [Erysipelotrichaceae bacterium]